MKDFRLDFQVSEVVFHYRFHRLHGLWLRVVDAISQIYYWITAAKAAMMKPHGICEIPNNRGFLCNLCNLW